MADPRFYRNQGPFTLAAVAVVLGIAPPPGADGDSLITDLASLEGAGPQHLSFFSGSREQNDSFRGSRAGFCLVDGDDAFAPDGMVRLNVPSVAPAWAAIAATFYPQSRQAPWPGIAIDPSASIGADVLLAPHVVIGAGADIGAGSRIGPGAAIGPGVAIGRNCDIGGHATITHAYLGDAVTILPGAQIGQPGFGFAATTEGHIKTPQLGRVIIQDRVEVGANTTIDRGTLGDTVIGEGSKIDNLVMIGHNVRIGRNCMVIAQVGIAGSSELGDFVVLAGQAGVGDHARIGDRARFAAKTGVPSRTVYEGGIDYGGMPAKPVREWVRELHALKMMLKHQEKKKDGHG